MIVKRVPLLCHRIFIRQFTSGRNILFNKDENLLRDDLNINGIELDDVDKLLADDQYPNLELSRVSSRPILSSSLNFMVVQPDSYSKPSKFVELNLEECVSLVNTVKSWKAVEKKIINTNSTIYKRVFNRPTFEELKEDIKNKPQISALFLGIDVLSATQLGTLEKELSIPVYDRFTTVLNIFRQHARTKQAKIQIALAELPYIRSHLREIHDSSENSSAHYSYQTLIGGIGEKFFHKRLSILRHREKVLKKALDDLKKQRELTKKLRKRQGIPIVSVIGYTNCGKTTLIKYLTSDNSLEPKNQLFSTLDVTVHEGVLPSNKKVLYVDTVGFISNIPLLLVDAFRTTLKDISESDLIIHVTDITHPDRLSQYKTVLNALKNLNISKQLSDSMIVVGNKFDKFKQQNNTKVKNFPIIDYCISATEGLNCQEFSEAIDGRLSSNLGNIFKTVRVVNGGQGYRWLIKNCTVTSCSSDSNDANHLMCKVNFSPASLGRWRKFSAFINEEFKMMD